MQGKLSSSDELYLKTFVILNTGHFQEPSYIFQTCSNFHETTDGIPNLTQRQETKVSQATSCALFCTVCLFTWVVSTCLLLTGSLAKKQTNKK